MAIRVICAGCMTSFEVDDRFAGKKGPCPKCGHIIEIPKETVIVHAPDHITDGKKTLKNMAGHDARPILQERFTFTGKQVFLGFLGVAVFFLLSYLIGLIHNGWASLIGGTILAFVIAFPIADVGYMLTRDDNDLDDVMFSDAYERRRRSLYAALVFACSWLVFEGFVYFLGGAGLFACLYLVPIAAVGSFGALIFFDCNFGKAFLIYLIFAFAAIIGRGLIITDGWTPKGWIWEDSYRIAVKKAPAPSTKTEKKSVASDSEEQSEQGAEPDAEKEPQKPALSREAPKIDPRKLNRRR
ncbi:MAG: hypothetical protein ACOX0A_05410 [Thermoguttaceae bacterium]|jgi:hypothetical protein